jgi:hypothetical protein
MIDTVEKAVLLIETFTNGLKGGVKHYDNSKKELKSVKEILEALQREGSISVKFLDDDNRCA